MTLSIKNDFSRPGGGYALLEGPGLAGVTAVSIEDRASGQYFGEDGKLGRKPFAFPVEPGLSGSLLLGPHIVDHVPSDLHVAVRSDSGVELGQLFWVDIVVSRNPGAITSSQIFEQRKRKAEAEAAEKARLAEMDAEAERQRQEAAAKAQADEAAKQAEEAPRAAALAAVTTKVPLTEPPRKKSKAGLISVLLLLALLVAAAGVFAATHPEWLKKLTSRDTVQQTRVDNHTTSPPIHEPPPPPPPPPTPPPPPPRVDCRNFDDRIAGLSSLSDDDKIKLGEEALKAECGREAFRAFDNTDWPNNEVAAWNLARFYDPNETSRVYREAATANPAYAASYYRRFRDRSPRAEAALAKICAEYHGGGATLAQACAR